MQSNINNLILSQQKQSASSSLTSRRTESRKVNKLDQYFSNKNVKKSGSKKGNMQIRCTERQTVAQNAENGGEVIFNLSQKSIDMEATINSTEQLHQSYLNPSCSPEIVYNNLNAGSQELSQLNQNQTMTPPNNNSHQDIDKYLTATPMEDSKHQQESNIREPSIVNNLAISLRQSMVSVETFQQTPNNMQGLSGKFVIELDLEENDERTNSAKPSTHQRRVHRTGQNEEEPIKIEQANSIGWIDVKECTENKVDIYHAQTTSQ